MDAKEQKRVQRFIDALAAQRNRAQDEIVNLTAVNGELQQQVAELQQQVAELKKPAAPPPVAPPTTEEHKG